MTCLSHHESLHLYLQLHQCRGDLAGTLLSEASNRIVTSSFLLTIVRSASGLRGIVGILWLDDWTITIVLLIPWLASLGGPASSAGALPSAKHPRKPSGASPGMRVAASKLFDLLVVINEDIPEGEAVHVQLQE